LKRTDFAKQNPRFGEAESYKTIITNIKELSEALGIRFWNKVPKSSIMTASRPSGDARLALCADLCPSFSDESIIIKYLGYELGTISNETNNSLNGSFCVAELEIIIEKLIKELILCSKCNLPELIMKIKKDKIKLLCNACGNKDEKYDTKIINYIIKNKK
jgi:translation initiation factor 2 beta subunit (eIF-2beta)/eIF-5